MAQHVLEAQELRGQNRNRVSGQVGGALVPQRLYNLAPNRAGGYAPFGRHARVQHDGADVVLGHIARLIGHDETGIATFSTTIAEPGELRLFKGTMHYGQLHADYESPSDAVHMENAGAYISRDAYLVLDREDRRVEPIEVRTDATPRVGSPINTSKPTTSHIVGVDYSADDDLFVAVTQGGGILRSTDRGKTWESLDDLGTGIFTSIAYGNGVWIAARDDGTIFRSDNDGDTGSWTAVTVYADWPTSDVTWGGGNTFFLAGVGANEGEPGGAISRSIDGGLTWAVVQSGRKTYQVYGDYVGDAKRVAYHPASEMHASVMDPERVFYSVNGGLYWETVANWDKALQGSGWTSTGVGKDHFYALNYHTRRIAQSGNLTEYSGNVEGEWGTAATLSGRPHRLKYNSPKDMLVVVGNIDSATPCIWQGTQVSSLSRNTDVEEAMAEEGCLWVNDVAFDADGGAVYVGSSGVIATTSVVPGLDAGTYNLIFVSYFNTKAGRFIFGLDRETHSFNEAFGNSLAIRADTKAQIIARNDWLAGMDPADAQEIVDSLRFDTYIQYHPEVGDTDEEDLTYTAATAEYTTRYAFTEPFPTDGDEDGLGDVGRELNELPLGRQIVANGTPTTVVFEKSRNAVGEAVSSRTAVHNGRVWGLARQDEDPWEAQQDDISLEIANQFNRFVLTYTEVGWANLIGDQSYVPIQPTQSQNFTGMISTPTGLMVMFDNEIFLVDGDPAFGNLNVSLYLDMAGCDLGAAPCKMGGLVFTVWDGKIWVLQSGQAQEISTGQWLRDDPFIRIAPEPNTRSLLALTANGHVLRYLIDDQFWLTDPASAEANLTELLPDVAETRFVTGTGEVWETLAEDGTPDTPFIVYREMDFGQPDRRTPLYTVKGIVEGPMAGLTFDRDEPGYDADGLPALFFASAQASNGTIDSYSPSTTGGIAPYGKAVGSRTVMPVAFRLPLRQTRSYSLDVRLDLRGMAYGDVLRLPLKFAHSAGGELR